MDRGPDGLTVRQRECLGVYRAHYREHGVPPTLRHAMEALGQRSPNGVKGLVGRLVASGHLTAVKVGDGQTHYVPADLGGYRTLLAACERYLDGSRDTHQADLFVMERAVRELKGGQG